MLSYFEAATLVSPAPGEIPPSLPRQTLLGCIKFVCTLMQALNFKPASGRSFHHIENVRLLLGFPLLADPLSNSTFSISSGRNRASRTNRKTTVPSPSPSSPSSAPSFAVFQHRTTSKLAPLGSPASSSQPSPCAMRSPGRRSGST